MSINARLDRLEREVSHGYDRVDLTPVERAEWEARIGRRLDAMAADGSLKFTEAGWVAPDGDRYKRVAEILNNARARMIGNEPAIED